MKALNDTAGPNGLLPTLLVFYVMQRFSVMPTEVTAQVQLMTVMENTRAELSKVTARSRVQRARERNVPTAVMTELSI